ncbi:hypothetical protein PQR63_19635 [Herbaspirillum rhizosphaerae]|uniref:Uncharacterized protein n=1 Tax=Herbaspirillum rhizosphaerae TaxID=346179 RepID=A0ABW8ZE91_9BURK
MMQAAQSMPKNPEIRHSCLKVNAGASCSGDFLLEKLPVGYIEYMIAEKK